MIFERRTPRYKVNTMWVLYVSPNSGYGAEINYCQHELLNSDVPTKSRNLQNRRFAFFWKVTPCRRF